MPWSADEGKDVAASWVVSLAPRTILDVGVGGGTYATRLRSLLQGVRITGVEIHEPYVERFNLGTLYDTLLVADARTLARFDYDLVIFGDVLEHMPLADAEALVRRAKAEAGAVLVAAPIIVLEQGATEGNEHEAHLHHFTVTQLRELTDAQDVWEGDVVGYFLWVRDA